MAKKYERFVKSYESSKFASSTEIWVDKETGVNYIKKLDFLLLSMYNNACIWY